MGSRRSRDGLLGGTKVGSYDLKTRGNWQPSAADNDVSKPNAINKLDLGRQPKELVLLVTQMAVETIGVVTDPRSRLTFISECC
jgi:hypothetical protein